MKNCPKCGRPVEDGPVCQSCGYTLNLADLGRDSAAVTANRVVVNKTLPGPQAVVPGVAHLMRSRFSPTALALTGAGIAALALLAFATRAPATPPPVQTVPATQQPAAPAHRPAAAPAAAPASISVARWTTTELTWRRHGTSGIMFELPADENIAVWHKRVIPVLTVQCSEKTAEVFVRTDSAASFENTGRHTVRVGFDDGDAVEELWDHSVNHDALFAPDGYALLNQLAVARTMSFTFTPFNASPALVKFSVTGIDAHLTKAAKRCGSAQ